MKVVDLLERHPAAWHAAIRHPFLDAVREGTLPPEAFVRWLVQDSLYVSDLLAFQARLLARAPRRDQAVLAAGLVAIEAELSWFEAQAKYRGVALDVPRHPTTVAYRAFWQSLEEAPYASALTALWTSERAYLEAWQSAAPGAPAYREFVEHWTTPTFADYVTQLERGAGQALESGDADEEAEAAFLEVVRLEKEFWDMAWSGERR